MDRERNNFWRPLCIWHGIMICPGWGFIMECCAFVLPCCVITKNGRKSFSSKSWFRRNLFFALLLFLALLGVLLFLLCFLKPCAAYQNIVEKELDLILLLDESNSMNTEVWGKEQEVAGILLDEVQKRFVPDNTSTHPDGSPKSVGRFGTSVVQYASGPQYVHQEYTTNVTKVVNAMKGKSYKRRCDAGPGGAGTDKLCGCTWYGTALSECIYQIETYGWKSSNSFKICAFLSDGINNDPGSDNSYISGAKRTCERHQAYSQDYMNAYRDDWNQAKFKPIPTIESKWAPLPPGSDALSKFTVPAGYTNEQNFTSESTDPIYAEKTCDGSACKGIIGPNLPAWNIIVPVCEKGPCPDPPTAGEANFQPFENEAGKAKAGSRQGYLVGYPSYPNLPGVGEVFDAGTPDKSRLNLPTGWYEAGSQTLAFCRNRSIADADCTARGIERYAKKANIQILGLFVSDDNETFAIGTENMQHFASCGWDWNSPKPEAHTAESIENCTYYASAKNFDEMREKMKGIAESLIDRIDSGSGGIVCLGSTFCILFLLLLAPLGTYLLYRPATLFAAAYRRKHAKEEPAGGAGGAGAGGPPPAGAGKMQMQASMSAESAGKSGPSPGQQQQQQPPGGGQRQQPPPGGTPPPGGGGGKGANGKWGKVNTDQYLWNMGGGMTPMNVNFGENAYVPSATHLQSVQLQDRQRFGDGDYFAPPTAAVKGEYAEDECQPGDLDYEYTRFWYGVMPSLNPNREYEIAMNEANGGDEGSGGGCFQPSGCCGCLHTCCPCFNRGVPSEHREVVRTTREEQRARYESGKAQAAVKTVPSAEGPVVNPMAAGGEERRMSWRRKGDSKKNIKDRDRSSSKSGRNRSKSNRKAKKDPENSWRRGGVEAGTEMESADGRVTRVTSAAEI
jgi:hypothetical protein